MVQAGNVLQAVVSCPASSTPPISDGVMRLIASQLAALLEGLQEYPFW